MINLLLGVSGSGKSYEANVFHILVALGQGRKVITNLPVVVEAYAAIDPRFGELLELRTKPQPIRGDWTPTAEAGAFAVVEGMARLPAKDARVFASVWDYFDTWRDDKGRGPLYVIDECQYPLPSGETAREVEEWFALHRHFNADVLLITQSYGKISRAIRDNVQMVYRCRKNVALGSTGSYTRKVQDGLRGEVVNTSIRTYKPEYFGLYRSHTQGSAASEFNANDVRPIWKHWSFQGAAVMAVLFVYLLVSGKFTVPWATKPKLAKAPAAQKVAQARGAVASAPAPLLPVVEDEPAAAPHRYVGGVDMGATQAPEPFAGRGLHLTGYVEAGVRKIWTFALSQNGQMVATVTDGELRAAGYYWKGHGPCAGLLAYGKTERAVVCDAPQVAVHVPVVGANAAAGGSPLAGGSRREVAEPAPQMISLGGDPRGHMTSMTTASGAPSEERAKRAQ